jgi:hypothetical protein
MAFAPDRAYFHRRRGNVTTRAAVSTARDIHSPQGFVMIDPLPPSAWRQAVTGTAASPPSWTAILVAIVVVVGALYLGKDILIPLALAILLSFMLAPIVVRLRRLGLGRIPSVVAVVLLLFVALLGLGSVVATQLADLAGNLPTYESNLRTKIRELRIAVPSGGVIERTSDMLRDLREELQEVTNAPAGTPGGQAGPAAKARRLSLWRCGSRSRRRGRSRPCARWAGRWSRRSPRRAWSWSS